MTTTAERIEGPGDAELISAVRGGDSDAYGVLFERHADAARRLARQLVRGPDSDDLVSEAFAKVLVVLQRGGGPDLAFRAYLLTAVRRLHIDRVRASSRLHLTDDLTRFDPGVPFRDTAVEGFEGGAAARAFVSLPERWQLVLWHTEVEGQKPGEIAPLLGMSANAVSALAFRAREGLRQAFLTMHVAEQDSDACSGVRQHLGAYVRGGMSRRDSARVESHLEACRPCAAVYLELTEVNSNLAGLLAPALLGATAAAYAGSVSSGSVAGGGAVLVLLDRAKDGVVAHSVASSVAGVAATAVIGGAVIMTVRPAAEPPPVAEAPQVQSATPEPSAAQLPDSRRDTDPGPRTDGDDRRPDRQPTFVPAPTRPDASPDLGGVPEPAPQPNPEPQPETETETEPPAEQYDVALQTSTANSAAGVTRIVVTVTGLPAGRTATLTSRSEGLVMALGLDQRCQPTAAHATSCTVHGTPTTYAFLANATQSGSISFDVSVDGTGRDTSPANNSTSVRVS